MEEKMRVPIIQVEGQTVETAGHTSRGNQLKWFQDGWWYKADAFGYEGLAETMVTRLLRETLWTGYVCYEPVTMMWKGRPYRGCRSRNFLQEGEELLPLEKLYRSVTGFSLAEELAHIREVDRRIEHTVAFVENLTGLSDFGPYLSGMLEMDMFFLNEDRHTNNIALIYRQEDKSYRLCPYFDMGLSLYADTREAYPLDMEVETCRQRVKAKPFSQDFDEQMDAAGRLYGWSLHFSMDRNELWHMLEDMQTAYEPAPETPWYSEQEWKRIRAAVMDQALSYPCLFET
ncbi:MAG: hypothetical protein HDR02_16455 [Lachnospiraceae bacterium]|nr:hypothetical protein [Lachnospiraceae bacterium]